MLMITAIFARQLLRIGIPGRWHKMIACGVLALATTGLLTLAVHLHNRRVIEAHDADIVQAIATASERAEEAANAADVVRSSDAAIRAANNQGAIRDAEVQHPVEVRAASGPATNAIADRLRARQAKVGASPD